MGIVGAGFVGPHHVDAVRRLGFVDVVAVAGSSEASAARKAEAIGARKAYGSYEALIADPDVHVVHNATPNYLHYPVSAAAIASGKHVVSDKPLAMTSAEAKDLLDRANRAGIVHAVTFNYRGNPLVQQARLAVAKGELGRPHLVHGHYLQDWLLKESDYSWRLEPDKGGASSAIGDIGSHWCDLAEFVTGHRIARLSARTLTAVPDRVRALHRAAFAAGGSDGETRPVGTEDAAVMQFETDRGAVGTTVISQISAGRKNRLWLEVDTAEESFAFDQEQPETLWCGRRESVSLLRRDPAVLSELAARLSWLPAGHSQGWGDCFAAFIADAYAAIRQGEPVDGLPVFADGLRAARITHAVLESATKDQWVDVPTHEPMEVAR